MGAYKCFMQTKFGVPGFVTKISQAKSGQKVDDFEPIYLGNYWYWWKMVCDFWAHYQLLFFWLCSCTPTWILFFFFFSFFLLFFLFYYSSPAIYFEAAKRTVFKVWRLKISGGTSARVKLGVPGWGIALKRVLQKFWTFKALELDESNFRNG